MKVAGPTLIAAAAVLLSVAGWSQDIATNGAETPYANIVARNMFGLVPIPKVDPNANLPPPEPPPKITLNGIMTIFGRDQALFKVANKPKPGQPAKDDAHVLAEGEMEDDITVKTIDHLNGKVTFDNHGEVQVLALMPSKEPESPSPESGGSPRRTMPGSFPQPGFVPGGAFQGRTLPGFRPGYGSNNPNQRPGVGTAGETSANGANQTGGDPNLTPEQNALLMEAQRMKYLQEGNTRMANTLPTTQFSEQVYRENSKPPPPQ